MGQHNFNEKFELHNLSEIFYFGMTKLRNMNLSVFIQCQYTRAILRKKNMGHTLLKKHSNLLIFNKVFYCNMVKREHK